MFPQRKAGLEGPSEKKDVHQEAIEKVLRAHVVDMTPAENGQRNLIKGMSNALLGVRDGEIDRTNPRLVVEAATIGHGYSKVLIGANGAGKSTALDALMERGATIGTRAGRGAEVIGKTVHGREKLRVARLDQEELLGKINDLSARGVLERVAAHFKNELPVDWEDPSAYEKNLVNQEAEARIGVLMGKITALFDM